MRHIVSIALSLSLMVVAVCDARADETAVRSFLRDYVEAFNKQNLDATSSMWAEQGVHVNRESGERTEGRAAIRADLAEAFKQPGKTRLTGSLSRVRMIKADVAAVEGTTTTSVGGEDPDDEPSVMQFTAILVKQDEKWQIDTVEESVLPQPNSAADALRDLAWLEGDWIDDSKESPVYSSFHWSTNRSFLIRSFTSKEGENVISLGTQVIGWDPRIQQIRSWTFNADGSFGDGIWSRSGEEWSIKSTQTLADGGAASGTYVVSPRGVDSFTLSLLGSEVEGECLPSPKPVSVTRLPESVEPSVATPKAAK